MEPLTKAQQMFNQRLMASHCMSESKARSTWKQLIKICDEEEDNHDKLEDTIVEINAGLKTIGLEIRGVSIATQQSSSQSPTQQQQSQSQDGGTPASRKSTGSSAQHERYYAIVNKFPDDVAKHCFSSGGTAAANSNEAAFIRHILEQFASAASEQEGNNGGDVVSMARSKIINSRTEMDKNVKITLPQAEAVFEKLLEEKWLTYEDPSTGNARRGSNAAKIVLAPRTYLELSYFLESAGMEQEDLPQLIYHTD